ncbi:transposase domain-containing protein [Salinicola sp. JS01]|uniref:transposase domain-containing protein n=1 Tax=Salinicola sp. JS01 TaxID=3050071 RepID=UPI00255BA1EA|nr:transposase domain-containing protein [Salinicola sp. JS01]WIX31214.1 transposase domain-containing protein [Salinicola sp. JS01]
MSLQVRQWFLLRELAGLPGMPSTPQGVSYSAKRHGWESRKRSGRGGGREYAFSSLPVETQAALLKAAEPTPQPKRQPMKAPAGVVDRESLWDVYERAPQSMKDEAKRKLQVVQAIETLVDSGVGRSKAATETAKAWGEGRSTVYRWLKEIKGVDRSDWLAALLPAYAGRTATAECSPEAWEYFKGEYLRAEETSIAACYQWTAEAARHNGWAWPSQRTITRWVDQIPKTTRVLTRQGEEALTRLYPAQQRTVRDLHAMYWLNGDGYKHNVFVQFPDGTIDRPKTWFWQDIYSRRIVGFRTDRTEHTDMIRLALGDVLERFGIPEHVTIDNTRAAANKWMTGGVKTRYRFKVREEDPIGLMPQLGIQIHWTSVFNGKGHGQAKPVERAFGVGGLGEYADKRREFAGAYTGPNPTAKPENYGSTAIPFEQFCSVLADAIRLWNQTEGRRTEICDGRLSYAQAFDASYQRNAERIRRPTTAQRRMWMLAAEAVTVQRDSSIGLNVGRGADGRNRYGSDALIPYIGRRVVVRFDPDSLHQSVHAYQADGRYIGEIECIHAVGFGDSSAAREWRRNRTQRVKSAKQQVEAERRMSEIEAAQYSPALTPEDNAPVQTDVTRASFGERRKVVGSDVNAEEEESPAERYSWDSVIETQFEAWRKRQV